MPIFHRECVSAAETTVMASAVEATGGTVISIAQDRIGRWQIWSRIGASLKPEEIDRNYAEALARLKAETKPVKKVPPRRPLKCDF
jgi:hypothetical protein